MIQRQPPPVISEVFVHVDQHDIAAIQPLLVDEFRQNRELIDRTDWKDKSRLRFAARLLNVPDGLVNRPRKVDCNGLLIARNADFHGATRAEAIRRNVQIVGRLPDHCVTYQLAYSSNTTTSVARPPQAAHTNT